MLVMMDSPTEDEGDELLTPCADDGESPHELFEPEEVVPPAGRRWTLQKQPRDAGDAGDAGDATAVETPTMTMDKREDSDTNYCGCGWKCFCGWRYCEADNEGDIRQTTAMIPWGQFNADSTKEKTGDDHEDSDELEKPDEVPDTEKADEVPDEVPDTEKPDEVPDEVPDNETDADRLGNTLPPMKAMRTDLQALGPTTSK